MTNTIPNNFIIYLAGPTGSGKTALAIQLARYFGAEIFSADSRQIYREMTIGTAKPSKEQLDTVPHHFIDHVSIHQKYSAGMFANEMRSALEEYFKSNRIAIVAGGTGLYFRALMEGLADFPDVPESIRNLVSIGFETGGLSWLKEQIFLRDPELVSEIDQQNSRRMLRALEVMLTTGKTLFSSRLDYERQALPYASVNIYLDVPRDVLYCRINERVDDMISRGLLAEVTALLPHRNCIALETVGYAELFDFMDGTVSMDEAIELIKRNTRRYAKRQMTWFRKYGNWQQLSPEDMPAIINLIERTLMHRVGFF